MGEHELLVLQRVHRAKRTSQRNKPRAERPHQYWGIDMSVPQKATWEMRVWPLAFGLQGLDANHRKRRW